MNTFPPVKYNILRSLVGEPTVKCDSGFPFFGQWAFDLSDYVSEISEVQTNGGWPGFLGFIISLGHHP